MPDGPRNGEPGAAPIGAAGTGPAPTLDPSLRPRLVRFFCAGPWPREEAEDLAHRTFALALRHRHQLANEASLLPWLFAIARNVRTSARRQWLRRRRVEVGGLELADERAAAEPPPEGEREERLVRLRQALTELPPRQRQCLLLQLREGLSYEEIGRTLALSPDTVRNHLAQARANLRRLLDDTR